jgi:TRAP-type mannitol/chloroaromatic compound transport system substrate-binding protein
MERRNFLKGAAIAGVATAGAAASSLPRPAISQGREEWRMVTTWPKNFPGLGTGAERVAQRITTMSEGRLTVKVYAAGELVPPFESFDAVSQGTADMAHSAAYYWQGKAKALNFFTAVPFGLTPAEHDAWIMYGGGQELWDEVYAGFNLKGFNAGNTGTQMAGWFRNEINSLEDLKGLKFRTAGLGGEVMRKLGVAVTTLPGGEIFPALQAGTIDAAEWVGPWNDLAFGFYRIAKNYYWPSVTEPSAALELSVNKQKWDALPADLKAIIEAATQAEMYQVSAEFNNNNQAALDTLINEHGVKLHKFSDEILTEMGHASGEVMRELADSDPAARKVWESYVAFRRRAMASTQTGLQGYLNARLLPFDYE